MWIIYVYTCTTGLSNQMFHQWFQVKCSIMMKVPSMITIWSKLRRIQESDAIPKGHYFSEYQEDLA